MQHGQFDALPIDLAHFDLPVYDEPSIWFASTTSMRFGNALLTESYKWAKALKTMR